MKLMGDLVEYRILRAQRYILRTPLETRQQARLAELEQRFEQRAVTLEGTVHEAQRRFVRYDVNVPAELEIDQHTERVSISNVSGGGISLSPATGMKRGEIAHLRFAAEQDGVGYDIPVQVQWTAGACAGCAFIGIPSVTVPPATTLTLRAGVGGEDAPLPLPVPPLGGLRSRGVS